MLGYTSHGHPAGDLTRDDVLDNITLYWLTNTGVSSGRLYWENKASLYNAADISVPAAVSVFPGENYQAPRSWTQRAYAAVSGGILKGVMTWVGAAAVAIGPSRAPWTCMMIWQARCMSRRRS